MNDVIDFIHTNRDRYVEELKQFLAIPSISALPEHRDDVRKCAEWTAAEMARIGLENVRVIDTPGTRSCTATGFTPRAPRPCSSTATTTCSRWTRSTCG